jgi:hypothetical protein
MRLGRRGAWLSVVTAVLLPNCALDGRALQSKQQDGSLDDAHSATSQSVLDAGAVSTSSSAADGASPGNTPEIGGGGQVTEAGIETGSASTSDSGFPREDSNSPQTQSSDANQDSLAEVAPAIHAIGRTRANPVVVSGTARSDAAVQVFEGDALLATVTAAHDGAWSPKVTLGEGRHDLRAVVPARGDQGGVNANSAVSEVVTVVVDRTSPTVVFFRSLAGSHGRDRARKQGIHRRTLDIQPLMKPITSMPAPLST